MEEQRGTKKKMGFIFGAILMFVAIVADAITFIPLAGDIVAPIFWPVMAVVFWFKGMGLINWRRIATGGISLIAEMVPAVQELPTIAVGMAIIVAISVAEDKTGISLTSMVEGKIPGKTMPRGARPAPVHQSPGVRFPRTPEGPKATS